ncbi:MAG TPA: class IV adenylate cyclase [Terriglobia bacterium]|jgi:predicted adenylyl cyclase CyaB
MQEVEIKFAVKETKAVAEKLTKLGFQVTVGRHLEKNYLFDDASGKLRSAGRLLRVRKTPSNPTVTFKGPISAASQLKHREEVECRIESAETMIRILEEVGFEIRMEYSKYRTVFEKDGFNVSLDETEAGNYLEVEGPSDEEIMKLGAKLGYSENDFVRRTYAELIGHAQPKKGLGR